MRHKSFKAYLQSISQEQYRLIEQDYLSLSVSEFCNKYNTSSTGLKTLFGSKRKAFKLIVKPTVLETIYDKISKLREKEGILVSQKKLLPGFDLKDRQ